MTALTIERTFHIADVGGRRGGCRRSIREGQEPLGQSPLAGRVPRVAKLMALAIRCDQLLRSGAVPDASALAKFARVSQPRMTQILNLTLLAPDIQERLLFLSPTEEGKPAVNEKGLRQVCGKISWDCQRAIIGLHKLVAICRGARSRDSASAVIVDGDSPVPATGRVFSGGGMVERGALKRVAASRWSWLEALT